MPHILSTFEASRPFTEAEAWMLFRLAAFAEAIGWTLLIGGIIVARLTGNDTAVFIAGNIHGTIYLAYFVAPLVLYPSLGWSRWRAVIAVIAGIPPYGSLLLEIWASHKRGAHGFRSYRQYAAYLVLTARQ